MTATCGPVSSADASFAANAMMPKQVAETVMKMRARWVGEMVTAIVRVAKDLELRIGSLGWAVDGGRWTEARSVRLRNRARLRRGRYNPRRCPSHIAKHSRPTATPSSI